MRFERRALQVHSIQSISEIENNNAATAQDRRADEDLAKRVIKELVGALSSSCVVVRGNMRFSITRIKS